MLYRYMQANFLIKYGKFKQQALKNLTEHPCNIESYLEKKNKLFPRNRKFHNDNIMTNSWKRAAV